MGGKPKKQRELAWHFLQVRGDGAAVLRDGRPLQVGQWLVHEGPVEICASGLHASTRAWDALHYSPGSYITRVEVEDVRERHNDKLVCTRRRPVWGFDAEPVLRAFARRVAKDCLDKWIGTVPQVVLDYLETGDESLRSAAESAAWSAAESAAWSAAESAAESAAWSAAESAAWSAAESAARSAAESAAWSAAWSAARSAAIEKYNGWLEEMLTAAAPQLDRPRTHKRKPAQAKKRAE